MAIQAEILMIGTELLIGQIQDTNATFLAKVLAENGINLYQKTTVGDNPGRIVAALQGALERSDVVLCSGGLGPTEDDITRECVAEYAGKPLEYHPDLFERIRARYVHRNIQITDNNKKQAMVPAGAEIVDNPNGTAPGIFFEAPGGVIACMPGVPHELEAMMLDSIIPRLRTCFNITGVIHYRVLKVCGMGESRVDSLIGGLIQAHANPSIGLLASPDVVRVRIAARAETLQEAEDLIAPVEAAVRDRLPGCVLGTEEDTLEGVLAGLFETRGWTLATVETVTGGALAQRLTAAQNPFFAGGRVLAASPPAGGIHTWAFDQARRVLLEYGTTCGLASVPNEARDRVVTVLVTPQGEETWESGCYGPGARNQLRQTIITLEETRKRLIGAD